MELDKKVMKKDIKRVGWGLIWYTLINLLVVTIVIAVQTIIFEKSNAEGISLEEFMVNLENEGTSMIIGVFVGILFLRVFMRKNVEKEMMFSENKKDYKGLYKCFAESETFNEVYKDKSVGEQMKIEE